MSVAQVQDHAGGGGGAVPGSGPAHAQTPADPLALQGGEATRPPGLRGPRGRLRDAQRLRRRGGVGRVPDREIPGHGSQDVLTHQP